MEKTDWRDVGLRVIVLLGINVAFMLLVASAYWLLGVPEMIGHLALGFVGLWGVLLGVFVFSQLIQHVFRLSTHDHYIEYVLMNACASAVPLLGWSAAMALRAHQFAAGASIHNSVGASVALFVIGCLACYIAYAVVAAFFRGEIYRLLNFFVSLGGFLVFALWPAAARALVGWLMGV